MTTWTLPANTTSPRLWGQLRLVLTLVVCLGFASTSHAMRIKEVASVEGVRSNQLTGFGLVVGLDGTGDQTTQMPYTTQGLANYLQQMGITLTATTLAQLQMKNVRLDSPDQLRLHAQAVYQQAVVQKLMPMNNSTGITDAERALIGQWFQAGARVN